MSTLRANQSFTAYDRKTGDMRPVPVGTLVDSSDDVVKGRESLFDKTEDFVEKYGRPDRSVTYSRSVERASAEPGERRNVSRPLPPEEKSSDDKGPVRRTPTKADTTGPKGKQDGEV